MPPSDDYQRLFKSGHHTQTQLPRSSDGGTMPAIYPKSHTELAAGGETGTAPEHRLALIHSAEDDCMFSISADAVTPFSPLPKLILLLVSVPPGEKIKASKASRVIWL